MKDSTADSQSLRSKTSHVITAAVKMIASDPVFKTDVAEFIGNDNALMADIGRRIDLERLAPSVAYEIDTEDLAGHLTDDQLASIAGHMYRIMMQELDRS